MAVPEFAGAEREKRRQVFDARTKIFTKPVNG